MSVFLVILLVLIVIYTGLIAWFNLKGKCKIIDRQSKIYKIEGNDMTSCKIINKPRERNELVDKAEGCDTVCPSDYYTDVKYNADTKKCTCLKKCEAMDGNKITKLGTNTCKIKTGIDLGPGLINLFTDRPYTAPVFR